MACFPGTRPEQQRCHYVIYSIVFAMGRPVPTVLFPSDLRQVPAADNREQALPCDAEASPRRPVIRPRTAEMHRMMAMCATMGAPCSAHMMELFTPARSVTRVFLYVNYLRRRYACKATRSSCQVHHHCAGQFHQQVWGMLDQKTSPILRRVPGLTRCSGL